MSTQVPGDSTHWGIVTQLLTVCRWALTNPHLSLHIPSSSRITIATEKKRNGHPKRPRHSLTSILSNVHLLLRVPSFARWPLKIHFFAPDVYQAWTKWSKTANGSLRDTINIVTDFAPAVGSIAQSVADKAQSTDSETPALLPWGIDSLALDYAPMKDYVAKTQSVFSFEREGDCIVCKENLPPGEGVYAACSNTGCEGVGHISCWSKHLLAGETGDDIIPISGKCPSCRGDVRWSDMMTELSLRLRGQKDIEKLLKKPRKRKIAVEAG